MQNEFEKQVREKMEELDFVPTPPVWEKIEEQIRQKKDRRRLVLWLPLLALLLGGGIWFMLKNDDGEQISSAKIQEQKPASEKQDNLPALPNNNSATNNYDQNQIDQEEDKTTSLHEEDVLTQREVSFEQKRLPKASIPTKKLNLKEQNTFLNEQNILSATERTKITIQQPAIISKQNKDTTQAKKLDSAVVKLEPNNIITITNPADKKEELTVATEIKPDTAAIAMIAKKPKQQKNSKWEFGVVASTGISGAGEGLKLYNDQKSADFASPNVNSAPPPPPLLYSRYYSPSPMENGLAFSVGIVASKQLRKRIAFSTGLQYNYFSTKIQVGRKINRNQLSSVSGTSGNFYANAADSSPAYTNSFHFVSLPVSLDFQLLKKMPLNIHVGLSVKRLVATNALQFDNRSQVYYQDKNAFTKTQAFSEFGLSYSLPVKKMTLSVGPQMQYGISQLEKNNSDRHLFSFGLKAQLLFEKK